MGKVDGTRYFYDCRCRSRRGHLLARGYTAFIATGRVGVAYLDTEAPNYPGGVGRHARLSDAQSGLATNGAVVAWAGRSGFVHLPPTTPGAIAPDDGRGDVCPGGYARGPSWAVLRPGRPPPTIEFCSPVAGPVLNSTFSPAGIWLCRRSSDEIKRSASFHRPTSPGGSYHDIIRFLAHVVGNILKHNGYEVKVFEERLWPMDWGLYVLARTQWLSSDLYHSPSHRTQPAHQGSQQKCRS
jgi:hypothetical protein